MYRGDDTVLFQQVIPERVILTTEIDFLLLGPRYLGAWLTDTRKLLRYSMGEIHIRTKDTRCHISDMKVTVENNEVKGVLKLENDPQIGYIVTFPEDIVAFNHSMDKVCWTVTNFSALAVELDSKEMAFQCMQFYESFMDANGLEPAM